MELLNNPGVLATEPAMMGILRAIERDPGDSTIYHDGLTLIAEHVKNGDGGWIRENKRFRGLITGQMMQMTGAEIETLRRFNENYRWSLLIGSRDDFDDYVLCLRDPSVPPTNNLAERHARKIKRKTHQVISFRSEKGFEKFCDGKTIIESARAKGDNLYDALVKRFNQSPDVR